MSNEAFPNDPYEQSRRDSDIALLQDGGVVNSGHGINISPEHGERLQAEHSEELGDISVAEFFGTSNPLIYTTKDAAVDESNLALPEFQDVIENRVRLGNAIGRTLEPYAVFFEGKIDEVMGSDEPDLTDFFVDKVDESTKNDESGQDGGFIARWIKDRKQKKLSQATWSEYNTVNGREVRFGYKADLERDKDEQGHNAKTVTVTTLVMDGKSPVLVMDYDSGAIARIRVDNVGKFNVSQAFKGSLLAEMSDLMGISAADLSKNDMSVFEKHKPAGTAYHKRKTTSTTSVYFDFTKEGSPTMEMEKVDAIYFYRTSEDELMLDNGFKTVKSRIRYEFDAKTGIFVGVDTGDSGEHTAKLKDLSQEEFLGYVQDALDILPKSELK